MGNNATTDSPVPVTVSGLSGVIEIASGLSHTCALVTDGFVRCWGDNSFGALGSGSVGGYQTTPVVVAMPLGAPPVVGITAGATHTCALFLGGTAGCWGKNSSGQLGTGVAVPTSTGTPSGVAQLSEAISLVAGGDHTCALKVNSTVVCWGRNSSGQLGNGITSTYVANPVAVNLGNVVALGAGFAHSCAINANGSVQCWGNGGGGQLGTGTTSNANVPQSQIAGYSNGVEISGGADHTCAMDSTGTVRCWGTNGSGELGNGTTIGPSLTPSTVSGVSGNISGQSISSGGSFSCASRGTGGVSCWGVGLDGQLGNGAFANSSSAVNVSSLNGEAVNLSAGGFHACVARAAGTISCWGKNTSGQLGDGTQTSRPTPVTRANFSNLIQVSTGGFHTCALVADSTVRCWGRNNRGQLGDGSNVALSLNPVFVSNLDKVVAVAAGDLHTCALLVDGTVRCWGDNNFGELGNGTSGTFSLSPVQVIGLTNAVGIAAMGSHTCALLARGGIVCWGENTSGQVGDSTTQMRTVPTPVIGIANAKAVSAGTFHSCAVLSDGSAACWGANGNLQLGGQDTASNHTTPVPVIRSIATINGVQFAFKLASVVAISGGDVFTCALQATGQPVCWGANFEGEMGNGTTGGNVARPVSVNSFTANVQPAANLRSNDRIAAVTALINCPSGALAHISLTLDQGAVTGGGNIAVACAGGLIQVPMTVPARGSNSWQTGPAVAHVEAIVKEKGVVLEHQHWDRAVALSQIQ